MKIGFNKPFPAGRELEFIADALRREHISGNGYYTKKCQQFFESRYGFRKTLLTSSCTDALEMSALLINIQPGDEVIMPSYTFPSSANAFILRGATIRFADTQPDYPNLDPVSVEKLISDKTRAIVVVHYGGISCQMDEIMALADRHGLFVIEDAAQAIDTYYKGHAVGSIGHLACFSFHESKNITSGEGGMLIINDERFEKRAEIIWEKGTNRSAFFRGEIPKYSWVDIGSSFLMSELNAAFLFAQLSELDLIQSKRRLCWLNYYQALRFEYGLSIPELPQDATHNGHNFFLVLKNGEQKKRLETWLRERGIDAFGHYQPLHKSSYYLENAAPEILPHTEHFAACLLRLPMYCDLTQPQQEYIVDAIRGFMSKEQPASTTITMNPLALAT
jgi:dTDP-4-amino-4,6-dideoxygalactose transaminase